MLLQQIGAFALANSASSSAISVATDAGCSAACVNEPPAACSCCCCTLSLPMGCDGGANGADVLATSAASLVTVWAICPAALSLLARAGGSPMIWSRMFSWRLQISHATVSPVPIMLPNQLSLYPLALHH